MSIIKRFLAAIVALGCAFSLMSCGVSEDAAANPLAGEEACVVFIP